MHIEKGCYGNTRLNDEVKDEIALVSAPCNGHVKDDHDEFGEGHVRVEHARFVNHRHQVRIVLQNALE